MSIISFGTVPWLSWYMPADDMVIESHGSGGIALAERRYRPLLTASQSLLHAADEDRLFMDVCRAVTEGDGYLLAWVGMAEQGGDLRVVPVAAAGAEVDYPNTLDITWRKDDPSGRGPTGTAIREGRSCTARNILTDSDFAPWVDEAQKHGFRSSVALPIEVEGAVVGALNIYAAEPDAFGPDELQLLEQLATDVGFMTMVLRTQSKLRLANIIVEASPVVLIYWALEQPLRVLYASDNISQFGYEPRALLDGAVKLSEIVAPDDRERVQAETAHNLKERRDRYRLEYRLVTAGGETRWVGHEATVERDAEGTPKAIHCLLVDITDRKNNEAALETSERRYRRLFEAAKDGILILDIETGEIVDANPFVTNLLGYTAGEIVGHKLWEIGFISDTSASRLALVRLQETGYVRYEDLALRAKDGRRIDVEFISNVYSLNDRDDSRVAQCNIRSIADRVAKEKELASLARDNEQRLKQLSLLSELSELLMAGQLLSKVVFDVIDRIPGAWRYPEIAVARISVLDQCYASKGFRETEWMLSAPIEYESAPVGHVDIAYLEERPPEVEGPFTADERSLIDAVARTLASAERRERAETKLLYLSRHDQLTGLLNRAAFTERVEIERTRATRGLNGFAVFYLDLDHFKEINDTMGHLAGDELLRSAARRIGESVRATDAVARIGGDEIAVLQTNIVVPEDAIAVARTILANFKAPFLLDGSEVHCGASVGISLSLDGEADAETLLGCADQALYYVKRHGRGAYNLYTPELKNAADRC